MKCSIGLRIAPREIQTYDLTIESMKKTGWNSGYIFAEPGLEINEKDYHYYEKFIIKSIIESLTGFLFFFK